jgi:hypothetical protein
MYLAKKALNVLSSKYLGQSLKYNEGSGALWEDASL